MCKANGAKNTVPASNEAQMTKTTTEEVGEPVFVVRNYKPKLGPFTNTWDNLGNNDGQSLHIGVLSYKNTYTSTFCERVKP